MENFVEEGYLLAVIISVMFLVVAPAIGIAIGLLLEEWGKNK